MSIDETPQHLLAESVPCPMCRVPSGSPCRTQRGKVATTYHTGRFSKVPRLARELAVKVPKMRSPGQPWQQLDPPPAPAAGSATAEILIGYARVSTRGQELASQLEALETAGCNRVFSEKISTRIKVRPELEAALALAREFRASQVRVALVVHELKRLGRGSAELALTSEQLRAEDIGLKILTGLGSGTDSTIVFAIAAAMAESERDYIRDRTLEGQESARRAGRHGGRPSVTDDDMATLARLLYDQDVPVPEIAQRLTISKGKNAGKRPSVRTVYRLLEETPQ
ncbi:recombinase family protein [Streptomyces sp. NPDC059604]|uniref:recombinase family protein n=1 Tax=Streptomyces sp. NPDC059604 TaxID=3346881 RepID=UPI0036922A8A